MPSLRKSLPKAGEALLLLFSKIPLAYHIRKHERRVPVMENPFIITQKILAHRPVQTPRKMMPLWLPFSWMPIHPIWLLAPMGIVKLSRISMIRCFPCFSSRKKQRQWPKSYPPGRKFPWGLLDAAPMIQSRFFRKSPARSKSSSCMAFRPSQLQ